MDQKKLSNWLKGIIIGMAVCGAVIFFIVFPVMGTDVLKSYPEFSGWFWPWLIFLWIVGIPCYVVLTYGWSIASEIGKDRSFTMKNAESLKKIMVTAVADTAVFFVGNLVFLFLNMNHPSVVLASLFVCFAGISVGVVAGALSHLVQKAAVIQEENDSVI